MLLPTLQPNILQTHLKDIFVIVGGNQNPKGYGNDEGKKYLGKDNRRRKNNPLEAHPKIIENLRNKRKGGGRMIYPNLKHLGFLLDFISYI